MPLTQITTTAINRDQLPIIANDISGQFDGDRNVFGIMLDQSYITKPLDSRDLQVVINGQVLEPYVTENRLPWSSEVVWGRGFKVTDSNITIFNAPVGGDTATITVINTNTTAQIRRYPFSAITIGTGD